MELNRTDYIILKLLNKNKCTSFFEVMKLQEIMYLTKTTRPTTYRKMMNMKEMGYVEKGCKSIQADTFYLLDKGINFIERKGEVEHD